MKLDVLPIGLYGENIYVLHENGHVLIVDPGKFAKEIMKYIKKDEVVDAILLTHGHEDHTGAVDDLVDIYKCPVYMDLDDYVLVDPKYAGSHGFDAPIYCEVKPYEPHMKIGNFEVDITKTPGHTKGSVVIHYRNLLFTGDTLFAGSIGRTDLFGGDESEMKESLKKFVDMPHDWIILPGHGSRSTIKQELDTNMYIQYYLGGKL
jgi:hydroxyacylglutathione hydrolase